MAHPSGSSPITKSEPASETFLYDAFISYRHTDVDTRWAKWIQTAIETYRVPKHLVGKDITPLLSRVYRDEDEAPASAHLGEEIEQALEASRFLIVVCSPRTPKSAWVNREIELFREMGRGDRILALLIEGDQEDSFPRPLREIRSTITAPDGTTREEIEDVSPLAADVRPSRKARPGALRRAAKLRLLATLLGCKYDDLVRRDARRRRRRRNAILVTALLTAIAVVVGVRLTRESTARADAASARATAFDKTKSADAIALRAGIETLRRKVEDARFNVFGKYAPAEERAAFAGLENDLAKKEAESERRSQEAREALERAARLEVPWGGPSAETKSAFATYFMDHWRDAMASKDDLRAQLARELVEAYDEERAHATELDGFGTLVIDVQPKDADVYLFRYVSYEKVRTAPPVAPRLVPVPWADRATRAQRGLVGTRSWGDPNDPFFPGDPCLVVHAVAKDSPAATAKLAPGDLVIRLDGQPCGDGLLVSEVAADSPASRAGIEPLARVESVDGERVDDAWHFTHTGSVKSVPNEPHAVVILARGARVTVTGLRDPLKGDVAGIQVVEPAHVVGSKSGARAEITVRCLHGGEKLDIEVPAGTPSGISFEPNLERTAYPLILSPLNRVESGKELTLEPGSYLLLARREGKEDQRYPVLIPRLGSVRATVRLNDVGFTPPGFVFVAPSRFTYGGDARAFRSAPCEEVVPKPGDAGYLDDGYLIGRLEVTYGEWFRFVNDPETRPRIVASQAAKKGTPYLPRDSNHPAGYAILKDDGTYVPDEVPDCPVRGVAWNDISAYIEWVNRHPPEGLGRWHLELPTEYEWEHAARGVDGRSYPWGDRFDFSLTIGWASRPRTAWGAPGASALGDESPYGAFDLGGSREEWAQELDVNAIRHPLRGGSCDYERPDFFRSCSRYSGDPTEALQDRGFRLVARPK